MTSAYSASPIVSTSFIEYRAHEMTPSTDLWDLLCRIRSLSFVSRSGKATGWEGTGTGTVVVRQPEERTITFTETGMWRPQTGRETIFTNVFRWTSLGDKVRLEHLRFGEQNPVFLFNLEPASNDEWRSASPHLCSEDCYSAALLIGNDEFVLRWSVTGPRKHEVIEYRYSV
jgi:hypothetical protein